ncbi:hypothetical protein FOA52_005800 [Chlamydomonas sp. UWO 241]|nr:hypothetical protein FOA52_005800 [Chlamydomonas sp. UWO 241]
MAEEYRALRSGVNELLGELGCLLGELVDRGALDEEGEPEVLAQGDILDSSLNAFFNTFGALKRRHDDASLSVAVLALTKAGKSTLINALVGREIMPVNNVPETARIVKVVHIPGAREGAEPVMDEPAGRGTGGARTKVVGDAAIRARLSELNSAARSKTAVTLPPPGVIGSASSGGSSGSSPPTRQRSLASGLPAGFGGGAAAATPCGITAGSGHASGALDMESVLQIDVPIAALQQYDTADSARLTVLDTPGPNEAGEEGLRYQVERLLGSVDAVLYLLDYTKLKTAEEAAMFARLREVNPQLVQRLAQRLFFVVNKVDTMATSEGQGPEETQQYVAELVTRQLGLDGFRLAPEQVVLISARNALASRLVLSGRAGDDTLGRFLNLAFGAFGAAMVRRSAGGRGGATPATAAETAAAIGQEQVTAAAHAVLEDSGVLDLEQRVLAYIYAHGGAVKLMATVDDIGRLLGEVRNVAALCRGCLQSSAESLAARADAMRCQLSSAMGTFDEVMTDAGKVADEVVDEVRTMLSSLRGRLFTHIVQTLEADEAESDYHNASDAAPTGRWARVRERFLSIFASASVSSRRGGGSSGSGEGGGAGCSRSRDEMVSLLMDLHEDLLTQIHAEVAEFWALMEACAASRHRELLARINVRLAVLSRTVETVVANSLELQVPLEPVSLGMRPPGPEEFHSDLTQLITRGVTETTERHVRIARRTCGNHNSRGNRDDGEGICRWGEYWTDQRGPRVRTVVETYSVSVFELRPSEIASHFVDLVDSAIGSTEAALGSRVRSYVGDQLSGARDRVQAYCDRYLCATTAALDASARGSEARTAALRQVERHVASVDAISARLAGLTADVERLVPALQDPMPYDDLEAELAELAAEMQSGAWPGPGAEGHGAAQTAAAAAAAGGDRAKDGGDGAAEKDARAAAASGVEGAPDGAAAAVTAERVVEDEMQALAASLGLARAASGGGGAAEDEIQSLAESLGIVQAGGAAGEAEAEGYPGAAVEEEECEGTGVEDEERDGDDEYADVGGDCDGETLPPPSEESEGDCYGETLPPTSDEGGDEEEEGEAEEEEDEEVEEEDEEVEDDDASFADADSAAYDGDMVPFLPFLDDVVPGDGEGGGSSGGDDVASADGDAELNGALLPGSDFDDGALLGDGSIVDGPRSPPEAAVAAAADGALLDGVLGGGDSDDSAPLGDGDGSSFNKPTAPLLPRGALSRALLFQAQEGPAAAGGAASSPAPAGAEAAADAILAPPGCGDGGGGDGSSGLGLLDIDMLPCPLASSTDARFDYASSFSRAMSTSHMTEPAAAAERSGGGVQSGSCSDADDEWTIVKVKEEASSKEDADASS